MQKMEPRTYASPTVLGYLLNCRCSVRVALSCRHQSGCTLQIKSAAPHKATTTRTSCGAELEKVKQQSKPGGGWVGGLRGRGPPWRIFERIHAASRGESTLVV